MTINCLLEFWNSVFTGLISNVVFTLLFLYGFQRFRYWYFLKRKFHKETFEIYWKKFPDSKVRTVTCRVKGNVIFFSEQKGLNTDFKGQFIINPINLKTGEGYHAHSKSDGFAFLKIIIKDDKTFLVDAPYTGVEENGKKDKIGFIVYQAFIWKKSDKKKR